MRPINIILFISFFSCGCIGSFAQQIKINEIMPSNGITKPDDYGDYSDWIELYNPTDTSINLLGYSVSDNSSNPFKWTFPEITVDSHKYLLIFASDKNLKKRVNHWETVVDWGDNWKYRLGTSEPPAEWKNLGFDDWDWDSGPSGFGFGDGDDSTTLPVVNSFYIRKTFIVEDKNNISVLALHADYDDAFVAYINGIEIARENIGTVNIPPPHDESSISYVEAVMYEGGRPKSYIIENLDSLLVDGENVIAIQVHNSLGSLDMTMIPFLSLGMNTPPINPNGINPLLDLPFQFLHTNFKLSAEGEVVLITDPQGNIIDQKTFGTLNPDISIGRYPDGEGSWFLFQEATPGTSNSTQQYSGIAELPQVNPLGGFYNSAVTINMFGTYQSDIIYYTLDGSEPTDSSQIYLNPFQITSTTVLRAKVVGLDLIPSRTLTTTYFIDFTCDLPVLSLSTNPEHFFDEEFGIYTVGDSAEADWPHYGANFWKEWEKPVHVEFFKPSGNLEFSIDAGVKIYGGFSRAFPQKSLAIFMRGKYGYPSLNYKLFDDLPFTEYESFILRNSGNDWPVTLFRDALMTSLVDDIDLDKLDYGPSIVFINGEYWGIHNIREKINEHFIAQHHQVALDSLDMLQDFALAFYGDNLDYYALYTFIETNDLSILENYDYVKSKMDVHNFISYFISEIYFANTDWPSGNIKYWRNGKSGKWRWILFDTDLGFGLQQGYGHNTLEFATEPNGPDYPNPPWSTLVLRKLLENGSFKNDFINYFADYSNSIFKADIVNPKILSIKSIIESEIPRHGQRWNQFDYNTWLNSVQVLTDFANLRIANVQSHFEQKFGLIGLVDVNISISDTTMGSVKLNSLILKTAEWNGQYFTGVPINLIAQPKHGYRFVHWEGSSSSSNDSLTITPSGTINLTAIFDIDTVSIVPNIVINEINYNSSSSFDPEDWIELYNNTGIAVDISGWIFKDSDNSHIFTIPQGTILGVDGYIVLCVDTSLFKPLFPNVQNFIGNLGFGLSGSGELIRLYDNNLVMMDSLVYDDVPPWPTQPDGNGPTLALKNPNFDNALGENWAASFVHGTPGEINDVFVPVELISFTAEVKNKNIIIKWTTASEINNYGFFIEKNYTDSWEIIGFVEGKGTSTEISNYEFKVDLHTLQNKSIIKYRLKQVDFNNHITYSEIIEIEVNPIPDKFELLQNYPNPFNSTTKIEFAIIEKSNVTLTLHNILGEVVKVLLNEEREAGFYTLELNTSELASGVYFYKLHAGKFTDIKKMIYLR